MVVDVLIRKLNYLRHLLADLAPYGGATLAQVESEHYKLERLFELLVIEEIDYAILRDSIALALRDFTQFVAIFEASLDK